MRIRFSRMLCLGAALAAFGGATACMSVGREFPVEPVRALKIGVTTRSDVERMFGEPWRTGIEDGQRTWTYGRYRYSILGDAVTRDLVVRFDAKGVVSSYTFNSTHPEDAAL
jgi:SmpA / OmlA family